MKNAVWFIFSILLVPGLGSAKQIQLAGSGVPKCYVGDAQSALDELLKTDFDPKYSKKLSSVKGQTVVGVFIDENVIAQEIRLPKCEVKAEVSGVDLSGLELSSSQSKFIDVVQGLLRRIIKSSNTQCQLILKRQEFDDETAAIILDLSKGSRHFKITVAADGMHPGLRMTQGNYAVSSPLGTEFGESETTLEVEETNEFKVLTVKSFEAGDRNVERLECEFDLL